MSFNKRFDGAVSITVVLKDFENKTEGLSPRLMVRAPVKPFLCFLFFLSQRSRKFFAMYMFAEKACFDVLCTCKATSLSKMARLVWRYSDDAGAIIENVYKFCMEEKKSGKKLSLNCVWDRTAAVTDVSRSTAQKIGREGEGTGRAATTKATIVIYVERVTV